MNKNDDIMKTDEVIFKNEQEQTLSDCEIESPNKKECKRFFKVLSMKKIFIGCIVFILIAIIGCLIALKENEKTYSYDDISSSQLYLEERSQSELSVYIPKRNIYDLTFTMKDETMRFEKSTYKEIGFFNREIVVSIFPDVYSKEPVGFCVFPKKDVTRITGILSKEYENDEK